MLSHRGGLVPSGLGDHGHRPCSSPDDLVQVELKGKLIGLDQLELKQQDLLDNLFVKQRSMNDFIVRRCLQWPHQKLVATEDSLYRSLLAMYAWLGCSAMTSTF